MPLFVIPSHGGARNLVVCIPKPPKIGSAYTNANHYRRPYTHTHHPDQDWLQDLALRGRLDVKAVKTHGGA